MTGGEVFAAAQRSVSRFWNLTRSHVYAELGRLSEAGLVEAVGTPGPRGARKYAATDAGRRAFRTWVNAFVDRGPEPDQLRSPLLLAVFFGSFVEPGRLRPLLEEYRAQHVRSLRLAEDMLAALGPDRSLPEAALARRWAYEDLMVGWLGDVVGRIADPLP